MPKLPNDIAGKVDEAAANSGFSLIEPGLYEARLTEVNAKPAATGNPMWVWVFEIVDERAKGRKQWINTVLTEKAMWKVAEMFAAFGVSSDTDTDELIGRTAMLEIIEKTITGGTRAGQQGNETKSVQPTAETLERLKSNAPAAVGASTSGQSEPSTDDPW